MTTVYFATNRAYDPNSPFGFGDTSVPYDAKLVTFARADVRNIDLPDESSGVIAEISDQTTENFSTKAVSEILAGAKNLLIFIHGFDNSFTDAIKRAAFNREWFAASGIKEADTTVVAFSWPSAGRLFLDMPQMPPAAYLGDQIQASRSAYHIAYFLRVIDQLQENYRSTNPGARIFLLAHSMGNHALSGAVQLWFGSGDAPKALFDEAILAAGDEVASTLLMPDMGQMTGLRVLAKRISIYHSIIDVAMHLSTAVNQNRRLGYDGPANKHDTKSYPPSQFRIVDCSNVHDYNLLIPPDASHQYYRRSKLVRGDIASAFAASTTISQGISSLGRQNWTTESKRMIDGGAIGAMGSSASKRLSA